MVDHLTTELKDIHSIYLFGSGVTDQFNQGSDVDLAVLCANDVPNLHLWDIKSHLEEILLREVDLVDLRNTTLLHQMQIIYKGMKIYAAETRATNLFEQHTTELYMTLNEDRKIIMEGIKQDLSVYG